MKKYVSFILIVILCFSLSACSGPKESAETAVKKGIESVKSLDTQEMSLYWGEGRFDEVSNVPEAENSEESMAFLGLLTKDMSYKIVSSEENTDAGTAKVTVEFTNVDMSKIMSEMVGEAFSQLIGYAFLPEDQQPSEEEKNALVMDILTELISREDNAVITKTVDLPLVLVEKEWKIKGNDDVLNAMFGGMSSFADEMNGTFSEDRLNVKTTSEDKIGDARNWLVSDIWNAGICDMSHYYCNGKSSAGKTMNADLTLQQLSKAMEEKHEYDNAMNNLPDEYSEIAELWKKVSGQVDSLYKEIQARGTKVTGAKLDTELYNQYFNAFDNLYFEVAF